MELKLFTDVISALGKVVGGLKVIVNPPKAERETMRQTEDETYRLIDTTLNMVIIRLATSCCLLPPTTPCARRAGWTTATNECKQSGSSGSRRRAEAHSGHKGPCHEHVKGGKTTIRKVTLEKQFKP